jgi:hydroxyethylthiazole kinase-like sugar kinase family protein
MKYNIVGNSGEAMSFIKQRAEEKGCDWWEAVEELVLLAKARLVNVQTLGDKEPDHSL